MSGVAFVLVGHAEGWRPWVVAVYDDADTANGDRARLEVIGKAWHEGLLSGPSLPMFPQTSGPSEQYKELQALDPWHSTILSAVPRYKVEVVERRGRRADAVGVVPRKKEQPTENFYRYAEIFDRVRFETRAGGTALQLAGWVEIVPERFRKDALRIANDVGASIVHEDASDQTLSMFARRLERRLVTEVIALHRR